MSGKAQISIPKKLIPVFIAENVRYRGAYGGRGSAKTMTFAKMTAVKAYIFAEAGRSGVILCAREFMNSLEESSLEEVKNAIRSEPWLEDYFDIGEKYIRTKNGRVKYVFAGLRHNLDSIKSKAKILLCWIDEAEGVSEVAYSKLTPTVREDGSEIWVTWNREKEESPTDIRFIKNPPKDAIIVEMNYWDNEFFPDVLEQERLSDQERLDPATYAWIWEGAYLTNSDSQVLAGKVTVKEFEPDENLWDGPYHGIDFGFAQDPTTGVRCWVTDDCLWIEREAGKVGLELDDTARFINSKIPDFDKYVSRADCARPESISYLKRHGLPKITPVKKWQGSVEDGIEHLRSYKQIIIHPRCAGTIKESRMYSYKVDRLTGDVLPKIVDDWNHYIDAIRYAIDPLIAKKKQASVYIPKRKRR